MDKRDVIYQVRKIIQDMFANEGSGHDWWHIYRVVNIGKKIAEKENADLFYVEMAALLHDLPDEKLTIVEGDAYETIRQLLYELKMSGEDIEAIINIIITVSYKGGHNRPPETIEAKVVQDADRLDAIGAIGIARCFTYAGSKGHVLYDPTMKPRENMSESDYRNGQNTAINHFYEKLLKLKDLMTTDTGRELAQVRHQFMESYLTEFYKEWDL